MRTVGAKPLSSYYNDYNQIAQSTDENGLISTTEYDAHGNPLTRTVGLQADGSGGAPVTTDATATISYAYHAAGDGAGLLATRTDARGKQTDYEYNARGLLTRVRAPANDGGTRPTIEYVYDAADRLDMVRSEVDLSALAQVLCDRLRRRDPERRVAVHIQKGLTARGDPCLLEIALANLLGNAWKYTSKTPEAVIAFERDGGDSFCVRDNGAGFPPEAVDRLFRPFSRLHSDHDFPGTGIGLAIVARVVARHGGRIRADAKPGPAPVSVSRCRDGRVQRCARARDARFLARLTA
ncbi:MAG: ATP-binding protein [Planctomycetota bacterium]